VLRRRRFLPLLLLAAPVHAASIEHQPVACVVAGSYPQLHARFTPEDAVARARIFFRTERGAHWYAVTMSREGGVLTGVLPRPTRSLEQFTYYVEAEDRSFATTRTAEFTSKVVAPPGACQGGMMATGLASASVLVEGPPGAAAVPAGFSSTGVVGASGAAAGAAAGAAGAGAAGVAVGATAAGGIGATTIVLATAGVVAAGVGVAVAAGAVGGDGGDGNGSGNDERQLYGLSGIVYARSVPTGTGPDTLTDPVAGAVVSTSLDGTTATTGGDGRFSLTTGVRGDGCVPYTVTIRAAGHPTYSVTATWAHGFGPPFTFTLSPPGPNPFKSNMCP
jgi:hypothetical protein